ncbi:hypothetical protein [Clostridium algidicarnis]|uniref:hypothetical protein n=1 Tax=Clostridium algidicarnis TaxID=37659 RepID=UPI000497B793|nr:hypothetical protein [Clostridium algidicarnis]
MDIQLKHFKEQLKRTKTIATINNHKHKVVTKNIDDKNKFMSQDIQYLFIEKDIINQGDIVGIENNKYIVVDLFKSTYSKATIIKVNSSIKFALDKKVNLIDAIMTPISKQDVYNSNVLQIPIGDIKLTVPRNSLSMKIDIDKRFIKWDSAWKITGKTYEHDGLVYFYCKKDQIDNNIDDAKEELANKNEVSYEKIMADDITFKLNKTAAIVVKYYKDNILQETNPKFIYTSNKPNICKVDDAGIITGLEVGKSTITISYLDLTTTINVEVEEVPTVVDLTIYGKSFKIYKGKTIEYVLKTEEEGGTVPSGTYTWSLTGAEQLGTLNQTDNLSASITAFPTADYGECTLKVVGDNGISLEKTIIIFSRML